jgi:hypothetical protein
MAVWPNGNDYDERFDGDGSEAEICSHGIYMLSLESCPECYQEYYHRIDQQWAESRELMEYV